MPATPEHDPTSPTRLWITLSLVIGGAVAGAAVGLALTPLGKIIAGAPPADFANYMVNMRAFAVMGAVGAPLVIWSALRHAPLWRTIVEPLAGAFVGAGIGALMGSGAAFLLLAPLGAIAAVVRLGAEHRPRGLPGERSLQSLPEQNT